MNQILAYVVSFSDVAAAFRRGRVSSPFEVLTSGSTNTKLSLRYESGKEKLK
jgi:D-serine deaminase-like pyridoxal phosphate-dependent protein